jgi:hypothetical protein
MIRWRRTMQFYFIHDYRGRARFFSSGPLGPLPANFSKTRAVWETAKSKVTGLSPRLLLQEQAFELGGRPGTERLRVLHAGRRDERSARRRLSLFLQRQRTRHIATLAVEAVFVPITGLMAILPGPNVFFYVLAIVMIIQWQALRGINGMLRRDYDLAADPLLGEWEAAVEARDEARFPALLDRLEKVHGLPTPRRLLWR